eukprot:122158-Pyramimonas_sp.AAC.1
MSIGLGMDTVGSSVKTLLSHLINHKFNSPVNCLRICHMSVSSPYEGDPLEILSDGAHDQTVHTIKRCTRDGDKTHTGECREEDGYTRVRRETKVRLWAGKVTKAR